MSYPTTLAADYNLQTAEHGKFTRIPIQSISADNPSLSKSFDKYAVLTYIVNPSDIISSNVISVSANGTSECNGNPSTVDINKIFDATAGGALSSYYIPQSTTIGAIIYVDSTGSAKITLDGITTTSGIGILLGADTTNYFSRKELQQMIFTTTYNTFIINIIPYHN